MNDTMTDAMTDAMLDTMNALIYTAPRTIQMGKFPRPVAQGDDNLIAVRAVGICGSDLHGYLGHDSRRTPPLILGHEAAGRVIAGPMKNARVCVNPLISCGNCGYCDTGRANLCSTRTIISIPPRMGAMAEFLTMPSDSLIVIPDSVSYVQAALAEPLAVCWHAVRLAGDAVFGGLERARCLVIGGGAIGVGAALTLQLWGCAQVDVAEPNDLRRDALAAFDGLSAFHPRDKSGDTGAYDLVIDAVGYAATRSDASRLVAPGGVIVHIGLGDSDGGLDIRRATLQEVTFIGTYTYTKADFEATTRAIFDGRYDTERWVETRALAEGAQAFDDILAGGVRAAKVVLVSY